MSDLILNIAINLIIFALAWSSGFIFGGLHQEAKDKQKGNQ